VSWTVTDNQTWITTSATSGANNGTFTVGVTANTGAARSGTVTVTGGSITRTITVSQSAGSSVTYYTIRNRWKLTYLFDNGANVGYGTTVANNNYKWEKVTIDATYFWLRNLGTGEYMHIENQTGSVQCTGVTLDWWSSQWSQDNVDGTYIRIRNRWQTASIVHVENQTGSAQYSGGQDGWFSAQWQLVTIAGRLSTDETLESETEEGEALVEIYPNPAKGNVLYVSVPKLKESELANVVIQDINGRTALETKVNKTGKVTHDLTPGLYFVRVRTNDINVMKKILIE
jgi:hypothetical protein